MTGELEVAGVKPIVLAAEKSVKEQLREQGFRTEVNFEKGHTIRRTRGDNKDYGIHSMQVRFLLHGERGTTQFLLYSGWIPEKVDVPGYRFQEWHHRAPMGADVGYHWDTPLYDDQGWMDCTERPSGRCYYDGSGLAGSDLIERFFLEGEDAVWSELALWYRRNEQKEGIES